MTPPLSKKQRRLVDMVIEEVSLVDRAANKKRFLIVKRREEHMENDLNETNTEPESPPEASQSQVLDTAASALEQLTQAVEELAQESGEDSPPDLGALATQLKDIAEKLGPKPEAEEEPSQPEQQAQPAETKGTAKLAEAINSLKAALGPLAALSVAKEAAKPKDEVPSGKQPAAAPPKGNADEIVSKQLGQLTEAVSSLAGLFKGQQQRLNRMEKSFGLPSSAQVETPRSDKHSDLVSWPLDLNTPVDKESVDSSLSFHD